jgi:ribosome-associated protein
MNGRDLAIFSARTADDRKADDVVVYDVRGITDVTDYFVIATAHSRSQVRAVVESIKKALKTINIRKMGQEGDEGWVLIDYTDCVVHVFSPELREYYSLESLWGDAPKVNWKREKIKIKEIAALLTRRDEEEKEKEAREALEVGA